MTERTALCLRCYGSGWVCEAHPDRPWDGPHACGCGAPGDPCPICNRASTDSAPELPGDFVVEHARDIETDPILIDDHEEEDLDAALARLAAKAKQQH